MDYQEFITIVEQVADISGEEAESVACLTLRLLARRVTPGEAEDLRAELPKDFCPLMDTAMAAAPPPAEDEPPFAGGLRYDEFLDRVAVLAATDRDHAHRATEAVLDMLGLRLSACQADDLLPLLPLQFRPALRRGGARSRGGAVPLSPDVFLHDVAKRAGVTRGDATKDVRAVFAVLREAVGEKEYHDAIARLPGEYRPLLQPG